MRTFYTRAAVAVVACLCAAFAGLVLSFSAQAQGTSCPGNAAIAPSSGQPRNVPAATSSVRNSPVAGAAEVTGHVGVTPSAHGTVTAASSQTGAKGSPSGSSASTSTTGFARATPGKSSAGTSGTSSEGPSTGPFISVTAPATASAQGSGAGTQSATAPITVTVGQGAAFGNTALLSNGGRPLVTVRTPSSVRETEGSPPSTGSVAVPAAVVVGRSSNPNANGTLLNAYAPVNVTGSTAQTTSTSATSLLPDLGSGSVASGTSGSGSGSLVNVTLPVNASATVSAAHSTAPSGTVSTIG